MRHASDDNAAAVALVSGGAAALLLPPPHHEVASAALVAVDDSHNRYFRRDIETEHPYPVAARQQWDAVFPEDVQARGRQGGGAAAHARGGNSTLSCLPRCSGSS